MIMPHSSDRVEVGYSPHLRLRMVRSDVVDSARDLSRQQQIGPTAALVLAEALAGVALLGYASGESPVVGARLEMSVEGPIRGLCVERFGEGHLRGETYLKVLPELDMREELDTREALGTQARARIERRFANGRSESLQFEVSPATPEAVLRSFFAQQAARPVLLQLTALAYDAYLELSRGLLVLPVPGGASADLMRLDALQGSEDLLDCLEAEPSLERLAEALAVPDLRVSTRQALSLGCVCGEQHVEALLAEMSEAEWRRLCEAQQPGTVTCRMCGRRYPVSPERLAAAHRHRSPPQGGD